jgi:hypothetical protein
MALYVAAQHAGCNMGRYDYVSAARKLQRLGLLRLHMTGGGSSRRAMWAEVTSMGHEYLTLRSDEEVLYEGR